ncbi:cytochrome P450 [Biscogniauxia marginata]|nr:cytochrome P450 [Biscogniauxia marginata]
MIVLCTVIVLSLAHFILSRVYPARCTLQPIAVDTHRSIADFTAFGANTLTKRLKLRAQPNSRLFNAFGIVNSFTTTDRLIHVEFLKGAKKIIRGVDWTELSQLAGPVLDSTIDHFKSNHSHIPLAALVRVFSFVLVLNVLFSVAPEDIDLGHAQTAAEAINRLWLQSKDAKEPVREDQELLQSSLQELLPDHFPCEVRHNPINLIIPAFETLWRVVLLTFIAATNGDMDEQTTLQLSNAVSGGPGCFTSAEEDETVVLSFAKEGLRLYPPTKRIYRAVPGRYRIWASKVAAADVEACHRDERIWGADALQFRPGRFHSAPLTVKMKQAYMPFSVGKHECPAASGFGDRMITVLLLTLVRHFGITAAADLVELDEISRLAQSYGNPLPSCRQDMEAWTIQVEGVDGVAK